MSQRRTLITLVTVLALLAAHDFQDQLNAREAGIPVQLITSTGPLTSASNSHPLAPFTQAFVRDGDLHLVIRTWFHDSAALAQPYLSLAADRRGVLHVGIKPHLTLFGRKCEFLRQFEVSIPAAQWKTLTTLQVFNEDTGQMDGEALHVSDPSYLRRLLEESTQALSRETTEDTTGGCQA